MTNNLLQKYHKVVAPALKAEFGFKNIMQAPKILKVVINVGVGRFVKEPAYIESAEKTLRAITGQKSVRTKSKKAISNFKIREGQEIGVMVTLRHKKMYEFLEKLLSVTFARTRDFRGISDKSFDRGGNYTLGFKEHTAFPEIKTSEVDKIHGLEIIINTSAKNAAEGRALLFGLGFPFVTK
ncbi:MAG: 50S ribosomal protein L5 [Candidatus Magasanikbacteria bacterium RIFOXYC2_FULL_42_28]|uniref:Large ribosomal subunit protein uL5 n=1 Tax=Candidatus Magasanikbacteria bacterium RIFOXYC2_FULL_42_28 TaxID=1798704 RepID=A0A1F6NU72_9BACT|nr:MAG: 50S ribosomal protein L5 [Candidatus Magasanikbacteria bacterium RIFOXYC2_FULL_42_28]